MTLAKVIIAAAWADNRLSPEEENILKDLLHRLPDSYNDGNRRLSAQEWTILEMYMDSPINDAERTMLIEELQGALHSKEDREMALAAIESVIHADGVVTIEEDEVASQVQAALDSVDLGIFGRIGRLLQGPIARRDNALGNAPNREQHFDDFIRNKVYYGVRRRLDSDGVELNLPEATLRRLSAIGGLMARVAHIDREVTDDEFAEMAHMLQTTMGIKSAEALFVAEVAVSEVSADMDFLRLTRELAKEITPEDGDRLLYALFAVADADGFVTEDEIEEIFTISYNLNLAHRRFIAAKMRVPSERRAT